MRNILSQIQEIVTSWPGITASPHRFGGVEFTLGGVEVGHFHSNGMIDIPFNSKIRDQLIVESKAEPHHLLKDTGWISFYIRSEADMARAIWLFKLSYLFNATRGKNRMALRGALDMQAELAGMALSESLRAIFDAVTPKR